MAESWLSTPTPDLLAKRGHALRSLGRTEDCLAEWRRALDLYTEVENLESLTRLCVDAAYILSYQDRAAEALDICQRGLAAAGDGVSAERCHLAGAAGYSQGLAGDYDAGMSLLDRSISEAEELGDGRVTGELYGYRARLSYYYMRPDDTLQACDRALEHLAGESDVWQVTTVRAMRMFGDTMAGRPQAVLEATR